ncbi:Glutamine cyclotransferase (modular protein) [Verrucomicrobia bacterium]|nr:Glutamine cyclotransferase (modular protein) [Verrucomicrobiota bacterium]
MAQYGGTKLSRFRKPRSVRLEELGRVSIYGLLVSGLVTGCGPADSTLETVQTNDAAIRPAAAPGASPATAVAPAKTPVYTYEIVHTWPHDRKAFTQGLVFLNGRLFESTGLYGSSSLRKVELATGRVLKETPLPAQYFAEGLAALDGKLFQLTWQNQKAFVYDLHTFALERDFPYQGEGWGLATDGQWLILSDGTPQIRFLDPATFELKRVINVIDHGQLIGHLNELEYIKGEIFANVWRTDYVVRIDPVTGSVLGLVNFAGLLPPADYTQTTDVLNGIAYDAVGDRLFVTGKCWPKLFEVRLKAQ